MSNHKHIIDVLCDILEDQNYSSRDLWVKVMKKHQYCLGCKGRCKHIDDICEKHRLPLWQCITVNDFMICVNVEMQ